MGGGKNRLDRKAEKVSLEVMEGEIMFACKNVPKCGERVFN